MKTIFAGFVFFVMVLSPAAARDFIVEFVEENYKETRAQFSYDPLIYHSIQVNTSAGPKVLVLTGRDYHYRKWLRQYIAKEKRFIASVLEERADEFITSTAFNIDVTQIHPFNPGKWKYHHAASDTRHGIEGIDNILVADSDPIRIKLISTIIKNAGYNPVPFGSARQALDSFKLYSGKYRMVLVSSMLQEMDTKTFVKQIAALGPAVPIIVDTGYQNQAFLKQLQTQFTDNQSVVLTPVLLRELSQTIARILGESG